MKAAGVLAEHTGDVAGEENSVETATLAEMRRQALNNGGGGEQGGRQRPAAFSGPGSARAEIDPVDVFSASDTQVIFLVCLGLLGHLSISCRNQQYQCICGAA